MMTAFSGLALRLKFLSRQCAPHMLDGKRTALALCSSKAQRRTFAQLLVEWKIKPETYEKGIARPVARPSGRLVYDRTELAFTEGFMQIGPT